VSGSSATSATEAAANTAAHDAIVSGFDAVAMNAVRKARAGELISSTTSEPSRIRHADHSVRAPSHTRTPAPTSPRATLSTS
jgi:hypothetical protein